MNVEVGAKVVTKIHLGVKSVGDVCEVVKVLGIYGTEKCTIVEFKDVSGVWYLFDDQFESYKEPVKVPPPKKPARGWGF